MATARITLPEPVMTMANLPPAPAMSIAVRLHKVFKRFGDSVALHELSLEIEQGEFISVLGPSACGKTTLLNLIAGFVEADAGDILLEGQSMARTPPEQRDIGVVFQDFALLPHMSVARNVGHALRLRGVDKAEIAARVDQVLALVKLQGQGERQTGELSGGQQQRVALARALVMRPKVLLLDDPFAGLDMPLRQSLQTELKDIQRKLGVTTVLVTGDQSEALSLSDRLLVMSAGRVHQVGTPHAVYCRPRNPFVASFVGDVNILPGRYQSRDEHAVLALGDSTLRLPLDQVHAQSGDRVAIYVRPENIRMGALGPDTLLSATVVTHVFHGDHVDIHLDVPALGQARLFVRQGGTDALTRWPVGFAAGLNVETEGTCAFTTESAHTFNLSTQ